MVPGFGRKGFSRDQIDPVIRPPHRRDGERRRDGLLSARGVIGTPQQEPNHRKMVI